MKPAPHPTFLPTQSRKLSGEEGTHTQTLWKEEMKLKPQMQEPPGQYHVASCSTSTQAELIALILGFSQENLNKNNAYLEAVQSIGSKNMDSM